MNKKKGSVLMMGGLLLMAAALFLNCYNRWEGRQAEASASAALIQILPKISRTEEPDTDPEDTQQTPTPDYLLSPGMEMPTMEIDGQYYIGILSIPALALELPVMDGWSYAQLKIAPCRYAGSAYLDDLVLAAHNYQSHFGMLKNLSLGDTVTFTDMDGNVFRYEVAALEILASTAIEEMTTKEYDLTLFTCTLDGASRLAVRCDRVEEHGQ